MAILYDSTDLLSLDCLSLEYLLARTPNDIAPNAMKTAVVIPNVIVSSAIVHFPFVPDNYFSMIILATSGRYIRRIVISNIS